MGAGVPVPVAHPGLTTRDLEGERLLHELPHLAPLRLGGDEPHAPQRLTHTLREHRVCAGRQFDSGALDAAKRGASLWYA